MAKLTKMVSALGSLKDLSSARSDFDDEARVIPDAEVFPPEEIRAEQTGAQTLLLRIGGSDSSELAGSGSQGDVFCIIHIPATKGFAAVLSLNPSTQIESGHTFATIADEGGWSVIIAMVEEFLGLRVDHVAQLDMAALCAVIDELGSLQVYCRTAFTAADTEFVEGTNILTGVNAAAFTSADPIDDAGQTRTRNQRAVLRALIPALRSAGLVNEPSKVAAVVGHLASGIHHSSGMTSVKLGTIANSLRQLQTDDITVVTVPTNSRRTEDGTVVVDFDPEALPALRHALTGEDLPEFFRYLVSLGY